MKNKRIFLSSVLVTVLLVGCSDDNSDDNPRSITPVNGATDSIEQQPGTTPVPPQPPLDAPAGSLYQDSFLQFTYPSDWTLSTENTSLSGQIIASETNELGGRANCGVGSVFVPGASIIELTDAFIEELNYSSDPTTIFLEVSTFPASRVSGNVILFGQTFSSETLTIYDTDSEYAHLVSCLGADDAVVELIFGTTRLN